jgi:hypothetical protein
MQHQKKDDEMNDGGEDKEYRMTIWNAIKEAAVREQVLLFFIHLWDLVHFDTHIVIGYVF